METSRQELSRRFRLVSVRAVERTMRDYLGDAIRARRKQLGLSQPELAERVGRDKRTISRWETPRKDGRDSRAFAELETVADGLETTPAKLLSMVLGLAGYRSEDQPASDDLRETLTALVAGSTEMKAQLAAMQIELEEIGKTVKRSE
jgi:transcriptional regulator with XRE-family HTH domain